MKDAPGTRDYNWGLLALLATICAPWVSRIYSPPPRSGLGGMHMKQPDLGTALVLVPMLVVGAFLAGLQWQHAAIISLAGILLVGSVFYPPVSRHILKAYQRDRITSFLHPEDDAKGSGYQLLQSKIAVGSVGFWGKGFGNGSQNQLGYIPVRYSDFIMSAWAEEQGFKVDLLAFALC